MTQRPAIIENKGSFFDKNMLIIQITVALSITLLYSAVVSAGYTYPHTITMIAGMLLVVIAASLELILPPQIIQSSALLVLSLLFEGFSLFAFSFFIAAINEIITLDSGWSIAILYLVFTNLIKAVIRVGKNKRYRKKIIFSFLVFTSILYLVLVPIFAVIQGFYPVLYAQCGSYFQALILAHASITFGIGVHMVASQVFSNKNSLNR